MTYDQWKTTNPRDYEPGEEDPASELDAAYEDLRAAEERAAKYRESLLNLFAIVKALAHGGALASPTLQAYLASHPAARAAADALGTERLDDPRF